MADPSGPRGQRRTAGKKGQTHSAEDARGAEIILRTRWRRIVFFGGLVGFVLLILVLGILRVAGA